MWRTSWITQKSFASIYFTSLNSYYISSFIPLHSRRINFCPTMASKQIMWFYFKWLIEVVIGDWSTFPIQQQFDIENFFIRYEFIYCDIINSSWLLTKLTNMFILGSKYRDTFSEEILKLQANQNLEHLRIKWWRNFNKTQNCSEKSGKAKDTSSLGLEQVGGCFVMILIGLGASFIISLQEFLYKVYHRAKITKVFSVFLLFTWSVSNC